MANGGRLQTQLWLISKLTCSPLVCSAFLTARQEKGRRKRGRKPRLGSTDVERDTWPSSSLLKQTFAIHLSQGFYSCFPPKWTGFALASLRQCKHHLSPWESFSCLGLWVWAWICACFAWLIIAMSNLSDCLREKVNMLFWDTNAEVRLCN